MRGFCSSGRDGFPRHVVNDVENPKAAAIGEWGMDEIH
jgi:hypothetical protein